MQKQKLRVGLVFGGRSGEHEVSLMSAKSIYEALDKEKYEAVLIGIDKEGRWLQGPSYAEASEGKEGADGRLWG